MRWKMVLPLTVFMIVGGCDDDAIQPDADVVPTDELTFVRFDAVGPVPETRDTSFYAVRGDNRELVLRYRPDEPGAEGDDFLEFEVDAQSLLRRPDGTPFAEGDSVLITVNLDDADRFIFRFEPAGLEFDPDRPAELEVTYREADDDLNADGAENEEDAEFEDELAIWRQERPAEPWRRLMAARIDDDLDEFEAEITGFTGFALAGN